MSGDAAADVTVALATGGRAKSRLCRVILEVLPEWFGRDEANRWYGEQAAKLPTFVARAEGRDVGFVTVKPHPPAAAEVLVMGVLPAWHGRGVGRALIAAAAGHAAKAGARYLTVKTLGEAHPSPYFKATRAFYRAAGFVPLEEFEDFFGKGMPCLFLAKALP
ncbi:MAG: GNAT family N-acetyltransferase [Alphaproteobacteria bacterium]|nr:GNAT family N-acetyltransferase [Alphaproteobacteria bacterium]